MFVSTSKISLPCWNWTAISFKLSYNIRFLMMKWPKFSWKMKLNCIFSCLWILEVIIWQIQTHKIIPISMVITIIHMHLYKFLARIICSNLDFTSFFEPQLFLNSYCSSSSKSIFLKNTIVQMLDSKIRKLPFRVYITQHF